MFTVHVVSWHTGDRGTAEHTHRWAAPGEDYSVAVLPMGVLQSCLPRTADHRHG